MTEFTKHKDAEWSSAPFYYNCNKEHKIQLKVTTNYPDLTQTTLHNSLKFWNAALRREAYKPKLLLVALVVDHMQANQPANQFVVTLLNQKNDNQHCSVTLACKNSKSSISFSTTRLILLDDLHQITPTCQFLKDDTLFFEVLPKS